MATPPVTVNVQSTQTWLQQHERLILIVLALVLTGWLGTKWINHLATVDQQKNAITQQQLADQKSADAQLAKQVQDSNEQFKAILSQVTAQNSQLADAISQRNTVLVTQQAKDQSMTNPQLADRISSIVPNVPKGAVTPTDTGVNINQKAAQTTVSDLEQIPVLQENVKDLQAQEDNDQKLITVQDALTKSLTYQVTGLNVTIKDEQTACTTQVTALKAEARKSKLKWFGAGVVTGFVGGVLAGHAL